MYGDLKLTYYDDELGTREINLGYATTISESYRKNVTSYPLISKSQDDALAVEFGSSMTYTVQFKHVADTTSNSDEDARTAKDWYNRLTSFIDRWQARTNGFRLVYTPSTQYPVQHGNNPSIANIDVNGFVKSLTRTYNAGDNTVIDCTMTFEVGTMYIEKKPPVPINSNRYAKDRNSLMVAKSDFQVLISDAEGREWWPLVYSGKDDSCVKSYTLKGGSENPFEYLEMEISATKLHYQYPSLGAIEPGRTRIVINAVGQSNMTVFSCSMNDGTYNILAYSDAEWLRGCVITEDGQFSALDWIENLLSSSSMYEAPDMYRVAYSLGSNHSSASGSLLTSYQSQYNKSDGPNLLYFPEGTNVWYILQVCAIYMNCKIFFSGNCAYLVDMTQSPFSSISSESVIRDYGEISLRDSYANANNVMYGRVIGTPKIGHEGSGTVVNVIQVHCSDGIGKHSTSATPPICRDDASVAKYKEQGNTDLYLPDLVFGVDSETGIDYDQSTVFANNLIRYRREPQNSVEFTVKEMFYGSLDGTDARTIRWVPTFLPCSRVTQLTDAVTGVEVNNVSEITNAAAPQLLCMSSYERHYPEGTTTYRFGVIENITISDSDQKLWTAVNSV